MTEENKPAGEDSFEKLFGKKPKHGYEFKYLDYQLGWRAVVLSWGCTGVGFGELAFALDPSKGLYINTECMSYDFVTAAIDEACRRIDDGQKATWCTHWDDTKGPQYKDSEEKNEQFIKSALLMFKYYIVNKPELLKDDHTKEPDPSDADDSDDAE